MTYHDKKALIEYVIQRGESVLDIGFWGDGLEKDSPYWPHGYLTAATDAVYGIDAGYDGSLGGHYFKGNAEHFDLGMRFDVLFAGDLIEHLSNPGLFLESCRRHLNLDGRLIITTPNAFNLFNIAEKFTKTEPTVNHDHTCYFNQKTLKTLLAKNGFDVAEVSYLYTLHPTHRESFKKRFLNGVYRLLSLCTPKFLETLVIIAKPI